MRCVLEQTSAPKRLARCLVAEELERWPGWQPSLRLPPEPDPLAEREEEEWALADRILAGSQFVIDGIHHVGGPVAESDRRAVRRRCRSLCSRPFPCRPGDGQPKAPRPVRWRGRIVEGCALPSGSACGSSVPTKSKRALPERSRSPADKLAPYARRRDVPWAGPPLADARAVPMGRRLRPPLPLGRLRHRRLRGAGGRRLRDHHAERRIGAVRSLGFRRDRADPECRSDRGRAPSTS